MTIDLSELIQFINSLNGQYALTLYKRKPFLIEIASNGFCFTPRSTGKARIHDQETLRRIVETYNRSGSLYPKDYFDITMNASYTLTIIKMYLDQKVQIR